MEPWDHLNRPGEIGPATDGPNRTDLMIPRTPFSIAFPSRVVRVVNAGAVGGPRDGTVLEGTANQ